MELRRRMLRIPGAGALNGPAPFTQPGEGEGRGKSRIAAWALSPRSVAPTADYRMGVSLAPSWLPVSHCQNMTHLSTRTGVQRMYLKIHIYIYVCVYIWTYIYTCIRPYTHIYMYKV